MMATFATKANCYRVGAAMELPQTRAWDFNFYAWKHSPTKAHKQERKKNKQQRPQAALKMRDIHFSRTADKSRMGGTRRKDTGVQPEEIQLAWELSGWLHRFGNVCLGNVSINSFRTLLMMMLGCWVVLARTISLDDAWRFPFASNQINSIGRN